MTKERKKEVRKFRKQLIKMQNGGRKEKLAVLQAEIMKKQSEMENN